MMLAAALTLGVAGGAYAVDKDRVEGSAKQMKGKVKETAGDVTGDKSLKAKGKKDRAVGKVQNGWGKVKDSARDTAR
jgi:uncharacterized protein YjbJ (UPF0337 family)